MIKEELQEVLSAVSNINEELYEKMGPEANVLAVIIEPYTGIMLVEWGEGHISRIWQSNEDDREWRDSGDYEPMEPFLRKKINNMIKYVAEIKL